MASRMPLGPAQEAWNDSWSQVDDTVTEKDGWYLIDRIKLERLLAFLPSTGKALEVGCGSARLSSFLGERGYSIVGTDYSVNALGSAQGNFSQHKIQDSALVHGDAFRLPFRDCSFDIVLSTGLLEHFEDPGPIVREMARVLKPGGYFYSDVVPKKFSSFRITSVFSQLTIGGKPVYEGAYSAGDILSWLRGSNSLKEIRIFGAGVLPPYGLTRRATPFKKIIFALPGLWRWLEGGLLGRLLGCYYFVTARKA